MDKLKKESIWDYPRPPSLVRRESMEVVVRAGGREILRTTEGYTVCETSHPPSWYFPGTNSCCCVRCAFCFLLHSHFCHYDRICF